VLETDTCIDLDTVGKVAMPPPSSKTARMDSSVITTRTAESIHRRAGDIRPIKQLIRSSPPRPHTTTAPMTPIQGFHREQAGPPRRGRG